MKALIKIGHLIRKGIDFLWHCRHRGNYSWPRTVRTRTCEETYVVCLDCGKRIPYDFTKQEAHIIGWP